AGSMERTSARAVEMGLPAIAFTEHVDFTTWIVLAEDLDARALQGIRQLEPNVDAADSQPRRVPRVRAACRDRFPSLRIITGVELGEPHWHSEVVAELHGIGYRFAEAKAMVEAQGFRSARHPYDVWTRSS